MVLKRLLKTNNRFHSEDLCVSAALDAVKEKVKLPWSYTSSSNGPTSDAQPDAIVDATTVDTTAPVDVPEPQNRILQLHNFDKALKEITPSSSEALGSLADLRKWNDEFGEGKKGKKKQQVWGKDRFGVSNLIEKIAEAGL